MGGSFVGLLSLSFEFPCFFEKTLYCLLQVCLLSNDSPMVQPPCMMRAIVHIISNFNSRWFTQKAPSCHLPDDAAQCWNRLSNSKGIVSLVQTFVFQSEIGVHF